MVDVFLNKKEKSYMIRSLKFIGESQATRQTNCLQYQKFIGDFHQYAFSQLIGHDIDINSNKNINELWCQKELITVWFMVFLSVLFLFD